AVQMRWRSLWASAGIEPQSPREMRTWLSHHASLLQLGHSIRESARNCERLREKVDLHRRELLASLPNLANSDDMPTPLSLAELLRQGEEDLQRSEAAEEQRRTLVRDVARLSKEQAEAAEEADRARRQLAEWREQW